MSLTEPLRIAAVGDNCIDVVLPVNQTLVGGNGLNVAVQIARLGGAATYFGAVGDDAHGKLVQAALAANGVDAGGLVVRDGATARTEISVNAAGERHFDLEDFGVCAGYAPDAEQVARLMAMDHVHIGWLDDGGALRRRLAGAGVSVSQDVSVNAVAENLGVDGLTLAFCSTARGDAAARADALMAAGALAVVATHGAAGSTVFMDGDAVEIAAVAIEPVDTTGAGDSYIAAFLMAWLDGASPAVAGAAAAKRAAETCGHHGGFPQ